MQLSSRVPQYLSVQIGQGRACSWEMGGLIQIGHQLYPHHGISSQGTALCAGQTGWTGNLCGCSHLQVHTSNIITHIFLKILMTKTERSYKTLPWPLKPKNQTRRLVSAILPPTAGPALPVHLAHHPSFKQWEKHLLSFATLTQADLKSLRISPCLYPNATLAGLLYPQ